MKDKKNIIIALLSVLVVLLIVLIAYNMGLNAGLKTAIQSGTTEVVQNVSGTPQPAEQPTDKPTVGEEQPTASSPADDKSSSGDPTETKPAETSAPEKEPESTQEPEKVPEPTQAPAENTPTEKPSATEPPVEDTTPLPKEAYTLTINNDDSWGENPTYYRMNMMLTNNTDKVINGWIVRVNVGTDAKIDSGWRGIYSVENGTLIIKNEEHNAKIPAGGTIDFGLIISNVTGDLSYTVEAVDTQDPAAANGNQGNGQSIAGLDVPEPTTDDWLHVEGNKIVDSEGKQVWLTGVNWFGYNTGTNIFDGIWNSDLNTAIQGIANHGFNVVRIPISAELILNWKNGEYPTANYNQATNYYLVDMNSLEIFDYIVGQFRACGMKIIIDIHSAKTDSMGHMSNMWYNGDITTEKYQESLVWMAERYAKDDTIIGYDLKNEPHGKPYESDKAIWNDSTKENNWKYVAEQTALKVLEKNPNALIFVEGIEIYPVDIQANVDFSSTNDKDYHFNWWGGNLRGVADYPIDLGKHQDQLVYSPHDYGPTVYQQPWFYAGYNYDSLYKDCWHDNWLYIHEDETAPLLIGEWGGFMRDPNLTWMTHMRTLISKYHLHHTFWCYNANSGDTGGLVKDDFITWDEEKYNFVKEVLWQESGKFVGLDHEIPLGNAGNGITLSDAKGLK